MRRPGPERGCAAQFRYRWPAAGFLCVSIIAARCQVRRAAPVIARSALFRAGQMLAKSLNTTGVGFGSGAGFGAGFSGFDGFDMAALRFAYCL